MKKIQVPPEIVARQQLPLQARNNGFSELVFFFLIKGLLDVAGVQYFTTFIF